MHNVRARIAATVVFWSVASGLFAQQVEQPVRAVTDPGTVTTRQEITPAGVQSVFDGRVYGLTFGQTDDELWVLTQRNAGGTNVYRMDWLRNRVTFHTEMPGSASLQGLVFDPALKSPIIGMTVPASAVKNRPGGAVRLLRHDGTALTTLAADLGTYISGRAALSRTEAGGRIVVPLIKDDQVAVVNADTGEILGKVPTTGVAPFGAVVSADGRTAWVSNWGGRWPVKGDPTLPTGTDPGADQVVVDKRGIASTGTVVRVDLDALRVTDSVAVGLHPTAIAWDEARNRLFVANTNSSSISVIDTEKRAVTATVPIEPFGLKIGGAAPTALATAADGRTLYVALGGLNAVAVVDIPGWTVRGYIPTGWYPNDLALNSDGTRLAVATLLGAGSGWRDDDERRRYVHSYRGTIHVLPVPDASQLASYTTAVAENNHIPTARQTLAEQTQTSTAPLPVPLRAGEPSLIEHVVYIIKENRTYDQVFGDMPQGNGNPNFAIFGATVTPNQHKLAEEFVLLDNFYATGGNSADGHQWVTQANETSYTLWPGYAGRSYPYDGTDPIAYSNTGFIWDLARSRNKTVRVYGEYAGNIPAGGPGPRNELLDRWQKGEDFTSRWNITAPLAPLNEILAKNYPPYSMGIPDVVRAQIFLKDVKQWSESGSMPNLVMLLLPSDHTSGAEAGFSSPQAMVADNDLALGQIVEGLTHSPFWPKMAIMVVEDDAQNGVDHVDGHRTVAMAISPYTRRGSVDSTFYSHQSMVKTIELMLGLPTMSLFDLIAHDMRNSFTASPDAAPYTSVTARYSIFDRNPPLNAMKGDLREAAKASAKMNFDLPDAAPSDKLNRIIWGMVKGFEVPYPVMKQAVFSPYGIDLDDDEREEKEDAEEREEREERERRGR